MANWTRAANDATDLALLADDKPFLLGANHVRTATRIWWSTTNNFGAGADQAATGAPTGLLGDDATAARSYTGTPNNNVYLLIEFASNVYFDTFAFLNHNIYSEGVGPLKADVANDANFTGSSNILLQYPSSDRRLVYPTLSTGDGYKYYSQYLRFQFTGTNVEPRIGEIFVGERRQLPVKPRDGYDTNRLESRVDSFESIDGNVTAYVRHKGRRVVNATFQLHETTYISRMETFFEDDTDFGSEPFLWVENPNTDIRDAPMMRLDPPSLVGPTTGVYERNFQISAKEVGPVYNASEF